MLFAGTHDSYLKVPYNSQLSFGTGNFTIQWWQYQTDTNSFPRVFQVGTDRKIGVSIEGGTFYFWYNDDPYRIAYLSDYKGQWIHFGICRTSPTVTTFYMNGNPLTPIDSIPDSIDFDFTGDDLYVGQDQGDMGPPIDRTCFGGYIDGFTWSNDAIEPFIVPTPPYFFGTLQNTVLLLLTGYVSPYFFGSLGSSVQNYNVSLKPVTTTEYVYDKYALLSPVDPIQKRKMNALKTVAQNYKDNHIYNKDKYAGTNDRYNAQHSVHQVRNGGATVPAKAQPGIGLFPIYHK